MFEIRDNYNSSRFIIQHIIINERTWHYHTGDFLLVYSSAGDEDGNENRPECTAQTPNRRQDKQEDGAKYQQSVCVFCHSVAVWFVDFLSNQLKIQRTTTQNSEPLLCVPTFCSHGNLHLLSKSVKTNSDETIICANRRIAQPFPCALRISIGRATLAPFLLLSAHLRRLACI